MDSAAVDHAWAYADARLRTVIARLEPIVTQPSDTGFPGTTDPKSGHQWNVTSAGGADWIAGFWPGCLWLMKERTGATFWQDKALLWQTPELEGQKTKGPHDTGFLLLKSYGEGLRLTGNVEFTKILTTAAISFSNRYNDTVGAVTSLDPGSLTNFRFIIDTMPNIEVLLFAARNGIDANGAPISSDLRSSLRRMALRHALTTARTLVRADGSTFQVASFDPTSGQLTSQRTKQGFSDSSTWSRGQAWAMLGFTACYRETGDSRILDAAQRTSDYFIANLPADGVPFYDFNDPDIPNVPRDTSAAAGAAAALLELSTLSSGAKAASYRAAADKILTALISSAYLSEGSTHESLLKHGTYTASSYTSDIGLIWGDFYFLKALSRVPLLTATVPNGQVTITATLPSAAEAGLVPGRFTVSRTGPTASALLVNLAAATGTAISGVDFDALPTSITIPAGQSSVDIPVAIREDLDPETIETVSLGLLAGPGYTVGKPDLATLTIGDDDQVVSIIAENAVASETGPASGAVRISRTGSQAGNLAVNLRFTGSAANGTDYVTIPAIVTIPAGQSSVLVPVVPIDDALLEGTETVGVSVTTSLVTPIGYTISANSNATVTIADNDALPLPSPWLTQDIGSVGLAGNASHNAGTFTVAGAGSDIGGAGDGFRFVYQVVSAGTNCDLIARLPAAVQNTNGSAKAGVMIRRSLDPGSTSAFMGQMPPANHVPVFVNRLSDGGVALTSNGPNQTGPGFLRLTCTAGVIAAFRSTDGTTWIPAGTGSIDLASGGSYLVGLAVSSRNTGAVNTTAFDQVSVILTPDGRPTVTITQPTDGSTLSAPGSLTLSATASDPGGSITAIDFFVSGHLLGSGNGAGNTRTRTLTNLVPGTYVFTARATDDSGQVTTSAPSTLTVTGPDQRVRIMPAGDGITDGVTIRGGYRIPLYGALLANGITPDFVGSLRNGPTTLADREHEGHDGFKIDNLRGAINFYLDANQPRVVLLLIGSRDVDVGGTPTQIADSIAASGVRFGLLLDQITAHAPAADVLVATLTPVDPVKRPVHAANIVTFNNSLPGIISTRVAAGKKLTLVDLFSAVNTSDLSDGINFNASGFTKISATWLAAIKTVLGTNSPPTVATTAAASPSPVTGSTATLSVLGADDAGESALTYTWATTGSPPATVSFSANGTNAAKSSVATFTKAGTYALQVTIKDAGNLAVTSSISVVVNQSLTTLTVSPAAATVVVGATRTFTAIGKDQFATVMTTPTIAWSTSGGGSIQASGLFTASIAGGPFTVTASAGGLTGIAQITVSGGAGDLNGDRVVNIDDLQVVTANFGRQASDPGFDPRADITGDGVVNLDDLTAVTTNFGKTYP